MIDAKDCIVVTGYDEAGASIGDLTSTTHKSYAEKWGFSFLCNRKYDGVTPPSWQKLGLVRQELLNHDLVLWLDMDVVVTNPNVDFREIPGSHEGLTFSFDWEFSRPTLFTAGIFIASHCSRSFRFLDEAMTLTEYSDWANYTHDQGAMQAVAAKGPEWAEIVQVLPHKYLAPVPIEAQPMAVAPWRKGDFLCHLTGISNKQRVEMFPRYAT